MTSNPYLNEKPSNRPIFKSIIMFFEKYPIIGCGLYFQIRTLFQKFFSRIIIPWCRRRAEVRRMPRMRREQAEVWPRKSGSCTFAMFAHIAVASWQLFKCFFYFGLRPKSTAALPLTFLDRLKITFKSKKMAPAMRNILQRDQFSVFARKPSPSLLLPDLGHTKNIV